MDAARPEPDTSNRRGRPSGLGIAVGASLTLLTAAGVLAVVVPGQEPLMVPRAVMTVPTAPPPGQAVPTVQDPDSGVVPDPRWVRETAAATAIPERVMVAYANATLRVAESDPNCGLTWNTLAGVGSVETVHGTFGGTHVRDDGTTAEPILGPALDGENGFAAIPATAESTKMHGDPDWDHAMGPMQFIPKTWKKWGVDADGDGKADPHDIDDAALAAARYLCDSGGDLATSEGWTTAVWTYNNSGEYVREVLARADAAAEQTPR